MIVILALVVAVLVSLALQPGGGELLQALATYLQDPTTLQDPALLIPALGSPGIIAASLFVLAGIIPLIEEGVKTVGIGLLAYRKPSLPQAFLWGVACGGGFALVEAALNTAAGLQTWLPVMLLRVGATLMHCFTGGLVGLAWYSILQRRRWAHAIGLYAGSVSLHALWNGLTTVMALSPPPALGSDTMGPNSVLVGLGMASALVMLVLLALATGLGLWRLTLCVRSRGTPA
jgi:RsiW-degrading membrane proteinase PrsW (M82 family)